MRCLLVVFSVLGQQRIALRPTLDRSWFTAERPEVDELPRAGFNHAIVMGGQRTRRASPSDLGGSA